MCDETRLAGNGRPIYRLPMDAAQPPKTPLKSGVPAAFTAYLIWGLLPLYLILVKSVPAFEFVGWRIIWTLPICLVIVALRKQGPELLAALRTPRVMLTLCASSALIAVNWVVYVWAVQNGHVLAASLGYYINPLVNVLLGTLVLGETLSKRQWLAVIVAAIGVSLLIAGALATLWISLTLAFSFGTYGLLRKQVAVGSLPGLTIESSILLTPAVLIAWHYSYSPAGSAFFHSPQLSAAIMLGGVLTATPLLLFAIAAKRMDYSALGFIQFLAPTIVFFLSLLVFGEQLNPVQLACFILIWTAIALFVWDIVAKHRARLTRPLA